MGRTVRRVQRTSKVVSSYRVHFPGDRTVFDALVVVIDAPGLDGGGHEEGKADVDADEGQQAVAATQAVVQILGHGAK